MSVKVRFANFIPRNFDGPPLSGQSISARPVQRARDKCVKYFSAYERQFTNHRSTDVGSRHASDVRAHDGRSDADVSDFRRKDFIAKHVDDRVRNADQRFAEHREDDRCSVKT